MESFLKNFKPKKNAVQNSFSTRLFNGEHFARNAEPPLTAFLLLWTLRGCEVVTVEGL